MLPRTLLLAFFLLSLVHVMPAAESDGQAIAIVTYNIRYANPNDGKDVWPARKEAVIDYVGDHDIVGMQEVTAPQLADLRHGLPEFESYGVGRDDGESGGEHSPIFYRKDRFEALKQGTFWLSETPEQAGSQGWDAALPRICSWVRLRDRKTGRELLAANTHFDHRGRQAREQSGRLLAQRAAELPEDLPVVLMGDFNCVPGSAPYQAIVGELDDARDVTASEPAGPQSTWNGFSEIQPDRIIDHVFVRSLPVNSLTVDDPKTDQGRFASDHLPVRIVVPLDQAASEKQ